MIYQSDRHFRLWDYAVGHSQMLLRSPASDDEPFNIDLVFLGVDRLDLPTSLVGLAMFGPEPIALGVESPRDIYRIRSGDKEYTVVAAAFRIYKNHHNLMDSSLDYFVDDQKDPGEVLAHTGLYLGLPEVASQAQG